MCVCESVCTGVRVCMRMCVVCVTVPNRTPRGLVWRLCLTLPSALQRELLLALKNVMHDGRRSAVHVNTKLLPCWIKDLGKKNGWMDLLLGYMWFFFLYIFTSSVYTINVLLMIRQQRIQRLCSNFLKFSSFPFFDLRFRSSKKLKMEG